MINFYVKLGEVNLTHYRNFVILLSQWAKWIKHILEWQKQFESFGNWAKSLGPVFF